jgi:hypothetical protein
MGNSESQVLPKPRINVIDGAIVWISAIVPSQSFVGRVWLPSPIKIISSKGCSENKYIKSIVVENKSKLERIESEAFQRADLKFLAIPDSVTFLGERCFWECTSLSSVRFESESRLSRIEKWAFMETGLIEIILPSSVEFLGENAFICANHFPQFDLNQSQEYHELKRGRSLKLV